ncbi:serine/threonine-protein kinase [Streptomyces sp. NPDC019507]|uniref:serine/threonine-protein kinase n=1 Tax=Streptomyces sp. NPDC019507 TaxID=3154689 RepID=UPI0033C8348A
MDSLTPEDPVRIGPFRLLGRLGTGGMGRVYLARSEGGRTVAVKVVHPQLAAEEEFRIRFAREVAALERVGGAGTAPLIDSDTDADSPWVAVAYVPGPALRAVVDDQGPLPPASVRTLAAGLGRSLEHIHAAGLVHRDLKPSNILLAVDGPRIIDFGIARAVDTVTDGGLTSTGAVVGSPGFMSPEQVRGEKVGAASDVFCVGAVLAYAATGRQPFGASDSGVHAIMFRIAHDEPDLEGLPEELGPLVRACLHKDPARRPSAAELSRTSSESGGAWLPPALLARLGEQAARLLDADTPASHTPVPHTPSPEPSAGGTRADGGRGGAHAPAPPGPEGSGTGPGARPPRPRRRWRTVLAVTCVGALLAGGTALARAYWPDREPEAYEKPPADSPSTDPAGDGRAGDVPAVFLGAWEGVLKGSDESPRSTARIEIGQGGKGTKTATYVQVTGERLCMGRSVLVSADDDRIVFGESDVTTSVPAAECQPAAHQTLTVRSQDVLEWRSGAVTATFRRTVTGPRIVPAAFLGTWKQHFDELAGGDQTDLFDNTVTITQGPVGAPLLRFEQSYPKTDGATGELLDATVHCSGTSVLGGVTHVLVAGPTVPDAAASDRDCTPGDVAHTLRVDRFRGKERLLLYGMGPDGEPAEYFRR